jgi:hypothetical protein
VAGFAPRRHARPVVARLNEALLAVQRDEAVRRRMVEPGGLPVAGSRITPPAREPSGTPGSTAGRR